MQGMNQGFIAALLLAELTDPNEPQSFLVQAISGLNMLCASSSYSENGQPRASELLTYCGYEPGVASTRPCDKTPQRHRPNPMWRTCLNNDGKPDNQQKLAEIK